MKVERSDVKCDNEDKSHQIVGIIQKLLIEDPHEVHQQACRADHQHQQEISVANIAHFTEASEKRRAAGPSATRTRRTRKISEMLGKSKSGIWVRTFAEGGDEGQSEPFELVCENFAVSRSRS
jgi:hypothetical protein